MGEAVGAVACAGPGCGRASRVASIGVVKGLPTVRRVEAGALAAQGRAKRGLASGRAEGVPTPRLEGASAPPVAKGSPPPRQVEPTKRVGARCAEPVDEAAAVALRDT